MWFKSAFPYNRCHSPISALAPHIRYITLHAHRISRLVSYSDSFPDWVRPLLPYIQMITMAFTQDYQPMGSEQRWNNKDGRLSFQKTNKPKTKHKQNPACSYHPSLPHSSTVFSQCTLQSETKPRIQGFPLQSISLISFHLSST